jgi:hypothetical protein
MAGTSAEAGNGLQQGRGNLYQVFGDGLGLRSKVEGFGAWAKLLT